ncbi:family 43 glycosylhydrolase [Kribbella sandramycini]|uniref:Family 43 glycosylhydrolase n=1 Tax=Kribbella sandramycini TaxID=60450 RepID=A0A7Y4KZ79_9ACTN|nr:family 43 glycosylhydrolase [Kribbella sandramycini]MBB6565108.1 GH43 family beta-xylosidase [Kribbella sandramycini]NOL41378.1 family 43 glycosylhydrolase [Kribbella sandramycini]
MRFARPILSVLLAAVLTGTLAGPAPAAEPSEVTAMSQTFRNPVNPSADPSLMFHNGKYYVATTRGDRIGIWSSPSLATLLAQPEQVVWRDSNTSRNTQMWAPAFRHVGNRWYIYYTASDGVDANHRMYVLESAGDDPLGPYSFKAKIADFGEYAIDGEPITVNGQQYFVWTGPGRGMGGPQQLYIVRMSNPWTATGGRVAIPADGGCHEVREGPTPIYGQNRIFLTYSTCDTGKPDYQLWMKSLANDADPMVAANWQQHPGPIFSRNDSTGVWGPGHHSFFKSPDGTEDWIAYHGKNTSTYTYDFRTSRAQKLTWNADGTPNLGSPLAAGATQALPSGDPGSSNYWINDFDAGTGMNQVEYAGNWSSGSGCGNQCFWSNDHWSNAVNATATIRFTGAKVALLSVKDRGNGIAAISIDGGPEQRVDYYSSIRVGEQLTYLSPTLAPGPHTIRIRVTGDKNAASSNTVISLDRIEVY